ncbi:MAG: hypothetical protein JXA87_04630 [Thermoleophilia bacterium]|nr:hypothetical protein [Thermoleophilia bacterium]
MHRQGTLHLTLSFPDGGTALVPAAWTDFGVPDLASPGALSAHRVLGSPCNLLRTRAVVDALLRRLDAPEPRPDAEETPNAAQVLRERPKAAGQRPDLEGSGTGQSPGCDHRSGPAAGQGSETGLEEG